MNAITKEDLVALGLDADTQLEPLGTQRGPAATVGEGRGPAPASTLEEEVALAAAFTEAPPLRTPLSREPKRTFVDLLPGVHTLHAPGVIASWTGRVEMPRLGDYLIDARQAPVVMRLSDESGEVVFAFDGPTVTGFGTRRAASVEAERLGAWKPEDPPPIVVPGASEVLGRFGAALWLLDAAARLAASGSLLDRVAALGMVARLWSPALGGVPRSIREIAAETEWPSAKASRWTTALGPEVRRRLLLSALAEVDALAAALPPLERAIAGDPDGAKDETLAWVHRRDDLESVAYVLRTLPESESLRNALDLLDREVATRRSMFALVPALASDPRLARVAVEEDVWWGSLGEG